MINIFYVYVLFRETGVPFYVGKGKGDRWQRHRYASPCNPHKTAIIRKMKRNGYTDVPTVILHENLTEETAFAYERAFITAIGRIDRKLGPLVNLTDGGEGVAGAVFTLDHRIALSAAHVGKSHSAKHTANVAAALLGRSHSAEAIAKMKTSQLRSRVAKALGLALVPTYRVWRPSVNSAPLTSTANIR